jgi:tetratricopeptide (TPR) repeat protein
MRNTMAKFIVFIGLSLCIQVLTGCFRSADIPVARYKEAQRLVDLGTSQIRGGKFDQARASFSTAEELAGLAAAIDGQGCVALLQGEFQRAEELFNRAYEMDRTYDQALANLALLQDIIGNRELAKKLYNEALEALPDNASLRNNRVALEYDLGRPKIEVIHELEKAILIAKHPVVRGNLMGLGSVDERGGSVQPVASKAGFGSNQDAKVGGLKY